MLMGIPDLAKKYDMQITGVIHAGAHLAEEAPVYHSMGVPVVVWIEAYTPILSKIRENIAAYPQQFVVNALVTDEDYVSTKFNVTNYDSMSSSIFEFGTHPSFSPDTVFVDTLQIPSTTLDTLAKVYDEMQECNFLNMDLQGAELKALMGATKLLYGINYIYSEVNKDEVYKGCAKVQQLDAYLPDFDRVETHWTPHGWGDALYIRRVT